MMLNSSLLRWLLLDAMGNTAAKSHPHCRNRTRTTKGHTRTRKKKFLLQCPLRPSTDKAQHPSCHKTINSSPLLPWSRQKGWLWSWEAMHWQGWENRFWTIQHHLFFSPPGKKGWVYTKVVCLYLPLSAKRFLRKCLYNFCNLLMNDSCKWSN